jgi:hypothetical protein
MAASLEAFVTLGVDPAALLPPLIECRAKSSLNKGVWLKSSISFLWIVAHCETSNLMLFSFHSNVEIHTKSLE